MCFAKIPQSNILVYFSCQERGINSLLLLVCSTLFLLPFLVTSSSSPFVSGVSSYYLGGGPNCVASKSFLYLYQHEHSLSNLISVP